MIDLSASPPDQPQRERAIDIAQSFIVQAPAGSGKTSLLVQRYLALLATVNNPEEIIAITFTRKAAAEMQDRIITALNDANVPTNILKSEHANKHHTKTKSLASAVLEQDTKQQWHLQNCPYRMRLQTIDSLCLALVNQAPFTANLTSSPNIAQGQDVNKYYELAAQTLLNKIDDDTFPHRPALETLLLALDNDFERCLNLFVNMLQKREQWLPYIIGVKNYDKQKLRIALEKSLENVVDETIAQFRKQLPLHFKQELINLAYFAQTNLQNDKKTIDSTQSIDFKEVFFSIKSANDNRQQHAISPKTPAPPANPPQLPPLQMQFLIWQQLTNLLLTQEGTWRKCIDKRNGFPAASSTTDKANKILYEDMKDRHANLLAELQKIPNLLPSLQEIMQLPEPRYNEQQWQTLETLIDLLPLLVAELDVLFHEHGVVDYTAISLAAERALGGTESPSDLALNLDYRIKHILVDEFQDISQAQYRLLEKLTAGWETGDGRTLFLVGDPMQSIYRFRQAEVGLFLRAAQNGIGAIKLESLQLTSNFRSTPPLINWLNKKFAQILPPFADIALGSIPFCAASAANDYVATNQNNTQNSAAISLLTVANSPDAASSDKTANQIAEAKYVVNLVKKISANAPQESIAILVSARPHLNFILPALKGAHIAFNAIELENLHDSMVVQDLFALTRALTDTCDRIAWLAILRAPWCGLSLGDLHAIANTNVNAENAAQDAQNTTILENLSNFKYNNAVSEKGKNKLANFLPILQHSMHNRGRKSFHDWIEETWLAIGGPATVNDALELDCAEQFWQLLETTANSSYTIDLELLAKKIKQLYISQSNLTAQVQIMTIHKAKGLEFDHVIVSGLERATRSDDKQLLMWLERPCKQRTGSDLILAPLKEVGAEENAIYNYLRYIEQQKDFYENGRLLYVASTRAKKTLNLIACLNKKESDAENNNASESEMDKSSPIKPPSINTLLRQLWPCFTDTWLKEIKSTQQIVNHSQQQKPEIIVMRPAEDWQYPATKLINLDPELTKSAINHPQSFSISDDVAARFGTVVHKCLWQLAQYLTSIKNFDVKTYCINSSTYWEKLLKQNGFYENDLDFNLEKIKTIITNIFSDAKGQWIFSSQHQETCDEFAISANINNEIKNLIIDRTFITADNVRWIIDYKTSAPFSMANLDSFFAEEKIKYQTQLELYAAAMRLHDQAIDNKAAPQPIIMLGLYFPLCQGWCEWQFLS